MPVEVLVLAICLDNDNYISALVPPPPSSNEMYIDYFDNCRVSVYIPADGTSTNK